MPRAISSSPYLCRDAKEEGEAKTSVFIRTGKPRSHLKSDISSLETFPVTNSGRLYDFIILL